MVLEKYEQTRCSQFENSRFGYYLILQDFLTQSILKPAEVSIIYIEKSPWFFFVLWKNPFVKQNLKLLN